MEAHEGERFVHEVNEDKPKRTLSQNALMWKYLCIVEQATGQPADDLHEVAKRKFLKPRQVRLFEEDYKLPASTTKLSKHEFSEYLDRTAAWTGIEVPDTEEYNRARGKEKIDYPTENYQSTAFD